MSTFRHDATLPFGPSMKVERYLFHNGLTLLHLADHAAPVATVQTWLGVGSRHEKTGKTGIAHLFEHLMFGGTTSRAYGQFDRLLEEAGAETNAATFLDWTFYITNFPAEALRLALTLEADRMTNLVLNDPEVAREKDVVMNERRQRVEDDVDGAVSEILYREAFKRHGYGWPTIGWMDDIRGMTTADCNEFYRTYYAPNNATLVVVGDVKADTLLPLVEELYGPIPSSVIPLEDVHPEPPQVAERHVETRKRTTTQKLALGYKSPAFGDMDHIALSLLSDVLFGGRASRMYRTLIQEKELCTDLRGWVGYFRDPALWDIGFTARGEHTAEEVLAAADAIFDDVMERGVTDAELARAKARAELSTLQGLETAAGKSEQLGFYQTVLGDPTALFPRLDAARRVTKNDVLRVARRVLDRNARTAILVRPDAAALAEADAAEDAGEEDADNEHDSDSEVTS